MLLNRIVAVAAVCGCCGCVDTRPPVIGVVEARYYVPAHSGQDQWGRTYSYESCMTVVRTATDEIRRSSYCDVFWKAREGQTITIPGWMVSRR